MGSSLSSVGLFSMKTTVEQLVDKEIQDNPAIVFSKTWCGFSNMAKKAFEDIGTKPKVIELDKRDDGLEIQRYLSTLTGANTVPRVFVKGKCIGGGSETKSMKLSGKLSKLLQGEA
uniref:glutaredoxin-like n=1 Tax=Styela clava TaxID=7725 RepID=UPI00193AB9A6|nr:glutaredoxin-like [Styela clava]